MDESLPRRETPPTANEKNAVQREVTRLLDALAPERVTTRASQPDVSTSVEQHRTPNGCILQGSAAAVSVTWYAEAADRGRVGELQVVLWRGVVFRRGARATPEAAQVILQEVLNPIERPTGAAVWRSHDGTTYDTPSLAAHCMTLLAEEMPGAS
jgi:hypothetical protein